jgi:ribosomal protein L40E
MGDPELHGDEQVLIRTQGVHVKSISFEGILTNKRIILVDRIKNILPPKEIPLVTIQSIEPGENAIRDLIIMLGVITKSGGARQMVLTFSREGGGNRAKERDEWVNQIRARITPSFEQVMKKVMPGIDLSKQEISSPQVVKAPVPPAQPPEFTRPPKKIMENIPESPQLPENVPESILGTYCTRCGTKVPDGSEFCTKCGVRILAPAEQKARPLDDAIRSVEPLIVKVPVTGTHESPYEKTPPPEIYTPGYRVPPSSESDEAVQPIGAPASETAPLAKKRFSPKLFSPKDLSPTPLIPSSMPTAVATPSPKKSLNKKKIILVAGIIVLIIIAALAIVVLPKMKLPGSHNSTGSMVTVTTTFIPVTTPATISSSNTPVFVPTQAPVTVPTTGVYVTVNYLGGFNGSYSSGGNITTIIPNSGAQAYLVDNATGSVTATFQKTDDTKTHPLTVSIYENGKELASNVTSAAFGKITISAAL